MENNDKNIRLPYFGIPKILPYLKPYKKKMIGMMLLGFLVSAIDAIFPLFNRYAIDHFIGLQTLDTLGIFVTLYFGILIIQVISNYYSTYWSGQMEMDINHDLRNASFNHLQTLSFSYFNQNNVGYIHARVMAFDGYSMAWFIYHYGFNNYVNNQRKVSTICYCLSSSCNNSCVILPT